MCFDGCSDLYQANTIPPWKGLHLDGCSSFFGTSAVLLYLLLSSMLDNVAVPLIT